MKEYLVCQVADNYGVYLLHARRFTEEEKLKYVESYRERGFVGISTYPIIKLDGINWKDVGQILNDRESDGSFNGCSNSAYIVTDDEWNELITLNNKKIEEKLAKERAEEIAFYKKIIQICERQKTLYTKEEAVAKAKEWNRIHNEGGEGYTPHFYTINEYENAKRKIEELSK